VTEDLVGDSTVLLPDGSAIAAGALLEKLGLNRARQAQLRPVIGYGSNPAPSQLARKFSPDRFDGDVIIPVMKGKLKDYDVVWTPVFVSCGALPATITPSAGTTVDVWVTWLDDRPTRVMDATEHADTTEYPLYVVTTLEGADFEFDGPDLAGFSIYVSCFRSRSDEERASFSRRSGRCPRTALFQRDGSGSESGEKRENQKARLFARTCRRIRTRSLPAKPVGTAAGILRHLT